MGMRAKVLNSIVIVVAVISLVAASALWCPAHAKLKPRPLTITGVIKKKDSDFVIRTGKATYRITGMDFSALDGVKVRATGIFSRGEKGKVFEIIKIQEVK